MTDWFEDEKFWEKFYGCMFTPERFAAAEEETEKVLKLVGSQPKHVLDLACGPGRHSVRFAKKGCSVTGIDRSNYLLKRAREYAAIESVEIEWIHQDMRDFVRENSFDLAISLFTSFGYFDQKDQDFGVLQNICKNLKPGGFFVIDLMGKERLAKAYQPTITQEYSDGGILIERPRIVEDWTRIHNEWMLIRGDSVHRFSFRLNIYSGQELRDLLTRAGFSNVLLYGDLSGNEYGIDASRLVAVAQKP